MENSFIYTISSFERLNTEDEPVEYDLNFGGFGSQYDNFKVEIIGMNFTMGCDPDLNRYFIVALDGLASDGVFCQGIVGSSSVLFPVTLSNVGSAEYITNSHIFFKVDNCRTARQIKMRILLDNFEPVVADTNIHNEPINTEWFLTMKVTPIID